MVRPLGWALTAHLCLCLVAYLGLLPTALVMDAAGHKYQWLAQLAGALVGAVGIAFGWVGGSVHNAYGRFGWFMVCLLAAQTALNLALTLGTVGGKRAQWVYRGVGWAQLGATYVAMVLSAITFLNLCSYTKMGQCVSHFARGSMMVLAAALLLVLMRLLGAAMVPLRRPVEAYLSLIMMAVGLFGALTEHNFLQPAKDQTDGWTHKDLQHTMIGILWLSAGLLGVTMTWRSHPRSRSVVPAITFATTGIAMIIHPQDLAMSSHVHFLFGASLVCYGICAVCEITLLGARTIPDHAEPAPLQYVTVLFLCASGMALMGANRDMVLLLINSGLDPATYALILLSCAFVAMLYCYVLVDLYRALAAPNDTAKYQPLAADQHPALNVQQRTSESSQTSTLSQPATTAGLSPASFNV
ncbi:hypothetical protein H4R19_000419 [Coemansia spiralis]|nr:hypothetical protein H4R19_000419 [Coemansia spiralis]